MIEQGFTQGCSQRASLDTRDWIESGARVIAASQLLKQTTHVEPLEEAPPGAGARNYGSEAQSTAAG